jgi:hypothetical protein
MKINELQNQQAIGNSQKTSQKASGGADFQKILEASQKSSTESVTATAATQNVSPSVPASLRLESLQLSERTMDTLESFGSALNNLEFSARDLEPFVEALENETQSILELKNQLPGQDSLSHLLERVATVSYIEAAKYRRGDYQ